MTPDEVRFWQIAAIATFVFLSAVVGAGVGLVLFSDFFGAIFT